MKKLWITLFAIALSISATTPTLDARPAKGCYGYHPKSVIFISGMRHGRPIFTEKYFVGYDRCGRPIFAYRRVNPPRRVDHYRDHYRDDDRRDWDRRRDRCDDYDDSRPRHWYPD